MKIGHDVPLSLPFTQLIHCLQYQQLLEDRRWILKGKLILGKETMALKGRISMGISKFPAVLLKRVSFLLNLYQIICIK